MWNISFLFVYCKPLRRIVNIVVLTDKWRILLNARRTQNCQVHTTAWKLPDPNVHAYPLSVSGLGAASVFGESSHKAMWFFACLFLQNIIHNKRYLQDLDEIRRTIYTFLGFMQGGSYSTIYGGISFILSTSCINTQRRIHPLTNRIEGFFIWTPTVPRRL